MSKSIQQATRGRSRLAVLLGLVLTASALPAQQSSLPAQVTASTYNGSSITSDPDVSCKRLDLSSTGVMSGTCVYDGGTVQSTFKDTSIDFDTKVGCKDGELSTSATDFSSSATDADITLGSTGTPYLLEATCPAAAGSSAQASSIEVDSLVKVKTDGTFDWD